MQNYATYLIMWLEIGHSLETPGQLVYPRQHLLVRQPIVLVFLEVKLLPVNLQFLEDGPSAEAFLVLLTSKNN